MDGFIRPFQSVKEVPAYNVKQVGFALLVNGIYCIIVISR